MLRTVTTKFFSLFITVFYKYVGTRFRTDCFKSFWDRFYVLFEKIGRKFDIIAENYQKLYDDLVDKEIAMAGISSSDSILIMGCGSLPSTTVLIAQKTQASIVAIDTDTHAIQEAQGYLKNHHIAGTLSFEHADGLSYSTQPFDIIVILHGVKNQKDLLVQLSTRIKKSQKIIFRTVCDEQGNISDTSLKVSCLFTIKDRVNSPYLGSLDSVLLVKKS